MKFEEALKAMKCGSKVKLPSWGGYWCWNPEKEAIIMHTKDGQELDIQLATGISYKTANGEVVNCEHDAIGNKAVAFVGTSGVQMGWLASQADMLAEDWIFAEE